jgi:hypothetical protein
MSKRKEIGKAPNRDSTVFDPEAQTRRELVEIQAALKGAFENRGTPRNSYPMCAFFLRPLR